MRTLSDSSGVTITHEWTPAFFNGFAGQFDEEALESLLANSDVEYIAEDGIMEAFSVHTQCVVHPHFYAKLILTLT